MTDTTHEAPELLPCPFCGGVAKYYHRPDTTGWSNTDWVSCESDCCGASTCMHETKEEAISAWNSRTDLVQQDDDDFYPASAGDDPIWLGGVEYITKSRSDDLVQAAVERGFWLGRKCGGSKAEIDAALATIREGGE